LLSISVLFVHTFIKTPCVNV
jgi:hypothetical protein